MHKSANVLDKLPKRLQAQAKDKLHQIWMAPTKKEVNQALSYCQILWIDPCRYQAATALTPSVKRTP